MFHVCSEYQNLAFKGFILPFALILHKQLIHQLNRLSSRDLMNQVLLLLNKVMVLCLQGGTIFMHNRKIDVEI